MELGLTIIYNLICSLIEPAKNITNNS